MGALLAFLLLPVAFLTAAAGVTIHALRRANRVVPTGTAIGAPLRWLWSPSAAATLHRRLRAACQLAGTVPGALTTTHGRSRRWPRRPGAGKQVPMVDGITQLAREVVEEAVLVDGQLTSAAWLARGLPRAQALAQIDYQVSAIEDAARRVHQLSARRDRLARPGVPSALSLHDRITAMEDAVSELTPRPPGLGG